MADTFSSTISERVVRYLEREIVEARLPPGQRLIEDEIGKQLGVSRSPVREALRKLEHVGLVEVVPRKGVFVRDVDPQDVLDLYVLHASVSGLIARLAARHRRPQDLEELRAVIDEMAVASRNEEPAKFLALYPEIMRVLTRASGNRWVGKALEGWEKTSLRYGYIALSIVGYMREVLSRYERLFDAVKASDEVQAEETMRASLEAGGRRLAEHLSKRGGSGRVELAHVASEPAESPPRRTSRGRRKSKDARRRRT